MTNTIAKGLRNTAVRLSRNECFFGVVLLFLVFVNLVMVVSDFLYVRFSFYSWLMLSIVRTIRYVNQCVQFVNLRRSTGYAHSRLPDRRYRCLQTKR